MKIIRVEKSSCVFGDRVIVECEVEKPYARPTYRISTMRDGSNAEEVAAAQRLVVGAEFDLAKFPGAKELI